MKIWNLFAVLVGWPRTPPTPRYVPSDADFIALGAEYVAMPPEGHSFAFQTPSGKYVRTLLAMVREDGALVTQLIYVRPDNTLEVQMSLPPMVVDFETKAEFIKFIADRRGDPAYFLGR